jgi:hypothetical protein
MPIFCQPGDQQAIKDKGFSQVTPVENTLTWRGITLTRTPGQHGQGEVLQQMGNVSGFVFQAQDEPTLYWAGDTVWYDPIGQVIAQMQPDLIITHSCGAVWGEYGYIVMDAAQTVEVCRAAPHSTIIATHMEALDHATISRADLRTYADAAGISLEQLLIPADGE